MSASTSVYLLTPLGERVALFGGGAGDGASDMVSLAYTSTVNAPGWATLELRADQVPPGLAVDVDWQLEITRSTSPALPERLEGETRWFVRRILKDLSRGTLRISAESALGLLATRTVAYAAGSAQASKSGPADDLIKSVARENLGQLATDPDRRIAETLFRVGADLGLGPAVAKSFSRKNALQVCQELAAAAAQQGDYVAFDVVWGGAALELRTYAGQRGADRSLNGPRPLLLEVDALSDVVVELDYGDEATALYAAGQGLEADRDVVLEVSPAALRSPWGRREATLHATYVAQGSLAALAAEARRGAWERRARRRLSATITASDQLRYGVDWDWGDRLTASIDGAIWPVRVDQRTVTIGDGVERVRAIIRVEQ